MGYDFVIPAKLQEIEDYPIFLSSSSFNFSDLTKSEVAQKINDIATEIGQKDVLCILEPEIFTKIYSLVRQFNELVPEGKVMVVESLVCNFSLLPPAINSIFSTPAKEESDDLIPTTKDELQGYLAALKAYIFFLHNIVIEAEAESQTNTNLPAKGRSAKKKHLPNDWEWSSQRTNIIRPMALAIETDLIQLYYGSKPEESLMSLFLKTSFTLLENSDATKDESLKNLLYKIISTCSVRYGSEESVVSFIVHSIFKDERYASTMAELLSYSEKSFKNNGLVSSVLREIANIPSRVLAKELKGASSIAEFLSLLSEIEAKAVSSNMSLLLPFLESELYVIRSAIVTVIGKLIAKVYSFIEKEGSSQSELMGVKNKESMLSLLIERVRDKNAYTRARVMQTWSFLCHEGVIPLSHWNEVTKLAIGRVKDKSSLVRKGALQLLTAQMESHPFRTSLVSSRVEATLNLWLKKLEIASQNKEEEVEEEKEEVEEEEIEKEENVDNSISETPVEDKETDSQLEESERENPESSEVEKLSNSPRSLSKIRIVVATLKTLLEYCELLESSLPLTELLLASPISSDVEKTIQFLVLAKRLELIGAEKHLKKMLPLIFSQEVAVRESVESAVFTLYLRDESNSKCAINLINLTVDASLGDLAAIEALIATFIEKGDINSAMLTALWNILFLKVPNTSPAQQRGALSILAMAAKKKPKLLSNQIQDLMAVGFGSRTFEDPLLTRWTCVALQNLPPEEKKKLDSNGYLFKAIEKLLVSSQLSPNCWGSSAEQAVKLVYSLHAVPELFCSEILKKLAAKIFNSKSNECEREFGAEVLEKDGEEVAMVDCELLGRFLFLVGVVALEQLVYIESLVKAVRRLRSEREKKAAEAMAEKASKNEKNEGSFKKESSLEKELGVSATADMELDLLQEKAEREIVSENSLSLISSVAPFLVKLCKNLCLLEENQKNALLRSSAVLALCRLMAVDSSFCEENLRLLFTILKREREEAIRSNVIIALADLAFRFPNLMEPWTEHVYMSLRDSFPHVRKYSVMILSHLILNDMMKVKGHISELVLRIEDEDERISNLVKTFFHEFSKKGNNPIYNLLPDILSQLSSSPHVSRDSLRNSMSFLLSFIEKEKQMEGLVDKLCNRFSSNSEIKQWQDMAYCLSLLTYSERTFKKLSDNFNGYKEALFDDEVFSHFSLIFSKAKKFSKPEFRQVIEEFERVVQSCHGRISEREEDLDEIIKSEVDLETSN